MVACSRTVTALKILEILEPIGFPSHNAIGYIPTGNSTQCSSRLKLLPTSGCRSYSLYRAPVLSPRQKLSWATGLVEATFRGQRGLVLRQV